MAFNPLNPKEEKINDLERDLYSRDAQEITTKQRPALSPHEKMSQYGWKQDEKPVAEVAEETHQVEKGSIITKIFLASVVFFVVAAGIAAYIILGGFNVISSKNVDISVRGLISVAAGEDISLDIIVKNNNNAALESGTMYVQYPEGARMADDVTRELIRDQIPFEGVPAGGTITKTVHAVLFGQKDSVQQIKISTDYKAVGSNATFSKEKTYEITIKSSPILMTVDVPKEVNSGQEIAITIDVASNSNTIVRNLLVKAEYPFGFNFISSSPDASFDKNIWRIGDFNPKEKRTIVIRGRIDGQNEEERTFRFTTGTAKENDEKVLAVDYVSVQEPLFIKKPFIGLKLVLGGNDSSESVVSAGEKIQGTLYWTNNLPITINDAQIDVTLSGAGLDRAQVQPGVGGFFRSVDNTIHWDKNSLPDLQSLEPGESGIVSFTFGSRAASQDLLAQGRDLNISVEAAAKGTRVQGNVPQEVRSTASGLAKIGTSLVINGRALYSIGPFENTGPMPPRVERKTTYTVALNLSNAFNDVSNIILTTELPPYVRWTGKISPASEQLQYNDSTRTVTWTIPDLRAGVGYISPSKEAHFQIELEPSLNQEGSTPDLTTDLRVSGRDQFTGLTVSSNKPSLNTRLTTDPTYRTGNEKISR